MSGFNVEISSIYHAAKDTPSLSTGNQLYTQLEHRQPVIHLAQAQATSYTLSPSTGNQLCKPVVLHRQEICKEIDPDRPR